MDLVKCQFMTLLIILLIINIGLVIGVFLKWNKAKKYCKGGYYSRSFPVGDIPDTPPTNESFLVSQEYPCTIGIGVIEPGGLSAELHCGGAIVGTEWALTAAHCIEMLLELPYKNIMIYGGNRIWRIAVKHEVIFMIHHKDYNNETFESDIGLIKVKQPFKGGFERTAALANKFYQYKVNSTVTAVGWSGDYFKEGYKAHDILSIVNILILNDKHCKDFYKTVGENITKSMFCAGSYSGKKLGCHLDSGGPLLHGEVIIGVASWGRDCGKVDQPTVYTKVAIFRKWIYNVMKTK